MRVDTGRLRVVAQNVAAAEALAHSLPDDEDASPLRLRAPAREDELPSPGAYIEEQRVRRGMSIQQLAVVTKIPARSLVLLEADRFGELPGQVFVKGFLRCCARALGVSQQGVMDLLHERERSALQARRKDRTPEPVAVPPPRRLSARERTGPRRGVRPPGTSASAAGPALPPAIRNHAPPRLSGARARATPVGPGVGERLRRMVPSAHAVLWLVVALFVVFLVLAAFNLAGAPVGLPQS